MLLRFVLRSRGGARTHRASKFQRCNQAFARPLKVVSANLLPEHKAVTEGDTEIVLTAIDRVRCRINDVESVS